MGLGSIDHISLAEARELAFKAKIQVNNGIDPIDERRRLSNEHSISFGEAVSRYVDVMRPSWSNEKHARDT